MEFIAAAVSIFSQIGNTALFVMFVTKPDTAPNVDRIRFTAVTSSFVRFRNKAASSAYRLSRNRVITHFTLMKRER